MSAIDHLRLLINISDLASDCVQDPIHFSPIPIEVTLLKFLFLYESNDTKKRMFINKNLITVDK